MKIGNIFSVLIPALFMLLSGCAIRSYQLTRERVDQDLSSGNKGYLIGKAPASLENKERKMTRTTEVIEVELPSPALFKVKSKNKLPAEKEEVAQNKGFVNQPQPSPSLAPVNFQKYTVAKNDTLQKISQKFYGTTKKWTKIYDANKEVLKTANKIYPGEVLNIPVLNEKSK